MEKAKLEDVLVDLLYHKYNSLVFHGGTAIWRCYNGNRFSRDLDFYLNVKPPKNKMQYYKKISEFLKESGFIIKEKGYGNNTDTMHFLVESNVKMKIDINFKYKKGKKVEYTRVDDSKIIILSLNPIDLLNEKIIAYKDKLDSKDMVKQTEIQDLYDIYYLISLIDKKDKKEISGLKELFGEIKENPPPNTSSLGHLILMGLPPSFELMMERIKKCLNDNN